MVVECNRLSERPSIALPLNWNEMQTLSVLALQIMPSIFGCLVLFAVLRRNGNLHAPDLLIISGAGTYVGPVIVAGLMLASLKLGINPFSWVMLPLILTLILIAWLIGSIPKRSATFEGLSIISRRQQRRTPTQLSLIVCALLWLTATSSWLLIEAWKNPTLAWDAVWSWGLYANSQIISALSDTPSLLESGVHPSTVVMISSWSAYWASHVQHSAFLYASNTLLYFGWILITLGLLVKLSKNWLIGLLGAVMVSSAPMIESHIALGGYADLWLATGLIAGLSFVLSAGKSNRKVPIATGIAIIISAAFIKANGFIYSALTISALFFGWLLLTHKTWVWLILILATLASWWVLHAGFHISLGVFHLAFDPEISRIEVGNRFSLLSVTNPISAVVNIWHAFIISSSFPFIFPLSLCLSPIFLAYAVKKGQTHLVVLLAATMLFLGFFLLSQSLAEYFYKYSTVSNDTGLTRFSHTLYWLSSVNMLLLLTHLISGQRDGINPQIKRQ